jgi:hypothetical protein
MERELSVPLARYQHGMFSRKQALRAGLSGGMIEARVRRGTWRAILPGVYTANTGELRPINMKWAVLLYAGRGAVLSHWTAAEVHKICGNMVAPEIHVSIPAGRKVTALAGMRVHRSKQALQSAAVDCDPPCTSVEDTVLDLVDVSDKWDDVCGWVTRAITREKTNAVKLRAAMEKRGRLRWRAELNEIISAAISGDHSVLEQRYGRHVERAHGLPEPERQVPFRKADGSWGRRDRTYSEYGVVVELDGQQFHPPEDVQDENERDNAVVEAGRASLRFGWKAVTQTPCRTAIRVARVLRSRGWEGKLVPCSVRCPVRNETI